MKYIKILTVFLELLPLIRALVVELDSVDDAPGTGSTKLDIVLNAVKQAMQIAGDSGVQFSDIEVLVRSAVESILKLIRKA